MVHFDPTCSHRRFWRSPPAGGGFERIKMGEGGGLRFIKRDEQAIWGNIWRKCLIHKLLISKCAPKFVPNYSEYELISFQNFCAYRKSLCLRPRKLFSFHPPSFSIQQQQRILFLSHIWMPRSLRDRASASGWVLRL